MSRPLKIHDTTPKSLREMSDSEMEFLVYLVLKEFASDDTNTGSLTSNSSNTAIGTFSDTKRVEAVGTHPTAGAVTTTNTTIYQNRSAISVDSTRPVHWESALNSAQELSDTDFNTSVVNLCLNSLVAGGIGSYRLSTSAPSGGTWVSKFTITDTSQTGNITYNIWRKTDDTVPSSILRPVKFDSGLNGLKEMTDAELQSIVDALRERIRTTGVGYYALQPNSPSPGTWIDLGSITDTRQIVNDVNYAGGETYFGNYAGGETYLGNYAGGETYLGDYFNENAANYLGDYFNENAANYLGNYFDENAIAYFNENAISYFNENAIGYVRTFGSTNAGTYFGGRNYSGGANYFGGATYIGDYFGGLNYVGDYFGGINYVGDYFNENAIDYVGDYFNENAIDYVGDYFNENAIDYAGATVRNTKENIITERLWLRIA